MCGSGCTFPKVPVFGIFRPTPSAQVQMELMLVWKRSAAATMAECNAVEILGVRARSSRTSGVGGGAGVAGFVAGIKGVPLGAVGLLGTLQQVAKEGETSRKIFLWLCSG